MLMLTSTKKKKRREEKYAKQKKEWTLCDGQFFFVNFCLKKSFFFVLILRIKIKYVLIGKQLI